MTGKVSIEVYTGKIRYSLAFDRNISIVRGNSGTGKSYLCRVISQALVGDETVTLNSHGVPCIVMPVVTLNLATVFPWYQVITQSSNTIFFIDEMCDCLHSGSFSKVVKNTTNYYVIVSRKDYSDLPYSINAIYEFKEDVSELVPVIKNSLVCPATDEKLTPCKFIIEDPVTQLSF